MEMDVIHSEVSASASLRLRLGSFFGELREPAISFPEFAQSLSPTCDHRFLLGIP
jgi:hypothetical protein